MSQIRHEQNQELESSFIPARWVLQTQNSIAERCSHLYSEHYGRWSPQHPTRAGQRIRLSSKRMTEWLDDEQASLHYVEHRGEMVAYAITVRTKVKDFGDVAWVTQLVVHSDFRKQGIARKLLSTAWGFTDFQCWGLLSANPYAVRALERATRRRCDAGRIAKNAKRLLRIGSEHVKYVTEESVLLSTPSAARVNTEFYLDHASIASKLTDVTRAGVPWLLGELPEGWEWLAFTFQDQVQACFGPGELDELLA